MNPGASGGIITDRSGMNVSPRACPASTAAIASAHGLRRQRRQHVAVAEHQHPHQPSALSTIAASWLVSGLRERLADDRQVLRPAGADHDLPHPFVGEQPGEREAAHRDAAVRGDRGQPVQRVEDRLR